MRFTKTMKLRPLILGMLALIWPLFAQAAIVHRDLQEWTAPAGESTTHKQNVYDDATGLQATVTAALITAAHADFDLAGTPKISVAVVGGRAEVTVNATALAGSTTARWYVLRVTVGGVDYTQATGTNVYVVTKVTETITAPTTLTKDYPTAGNNTTHLVINGTGTVDMAGFKIDFANGPNSVLYGRITVGDGVTLSGGGAATTPTIKATGKGDGNVVLGSCTFNACGPALEYTGNAFDDGYVTCGAITVNANSLATQDNALATSQPQIKQSLDGNSNYPSTYSGFKILKGRIQLDNVSHVTVAGRLSGLRCGVHFTGTTGKQAILGDLYSHCTVTTNTWADVANLELTSNQVTFSGKVLLRGGQWVIHAAAGVSMGSNVIVSEGYSHSYIDIPGHASLNTTVEQVIFLPGHDDAAMAPANTIGRVRVRGNGARVFVKRCTFVGKVGDTWEASAVAIDETHELAELTSCIFYKLQVDRGPGVTGDGAVSPCSTAEVEQTTSGSPLRPTDPDRLTLGNYNMSYQSVTVGGDTFQTYLVGQTGGTVGANDIASVDPGFVGGTGTYTWNETDILNGTDSVSDVWTEIRAFYTPTASQLNGTGSGGVDVGAVDVQTDVTAPTLVSATWNDALNIITLTYNENLDTGSIPATTAYTVTGRTVTQVTMSATTEVYVTVDGNLAQNATISYVVPGANPVQDVAGNDAAALTNQAITGIPAPGGLGGLLKAFGSGFGL